MAISLFIYLDLQNQHQTSEMVLRNILLVQLESFAGSTAMFDEQMISD